MRKVVQILDFLEGERVLENGDIVDRSGEVGVGSAGVAVATNVDRLVVRVVLRPKRGGLGREHAVDVELVTRGALVDEGDVMPIAVGDRDDGGDVFRDADVPALPSLPAAGST